MNEEEKKIINDLKNKVNDPLKAYENYVDTFILVNIKECKQLVNLIEKQQKEIEKLKDELKEERNLNKSALGTLKECVHKDIIKEKYISIDKITELIANHKKFLFDEFTQYEENDIENRKAIQYASARLTFLLEDIYKIGE